MLESDRPRRPKVPKPVALPPGLTPHEEAIVRTRKGLDVGKAFLSSDLPLQLHGFVSELVDVDTEADNPFGFMKTIPVAKDVDKVSIASLSHTEVVVDDVPITVPVPDMVQAWSVFKELWKLNDNGPAGLEARQRLMPVLQEKLLTIWVGLLKIHVVSDKLSSLQDSCRSSIS